MSKIFIFSETNTHIYQGDIHQSSSKTSHLWIPLFLALDVTSEAEDKQARSMQCHPKI